MPSRTPFHELPSDDLERFLVELARTDSASRSARQRAVLAVTSTALGAGLFVGAAGHASQSTLLKGSVALAAKWLAIGVGAGVLSISAAQGVQHWVATPRPTRLSPPNHTERARAPRANGPRVAAAEVRLPAVSEPAPLASASRSSANAAQTSARPVPSAAAPASASQNAFEHLNPSPELPGELSRELSLLEQARAALGSQAPSRALDTLDLHRRAFPHGTLRTEAEALRVEAEAQAGNTVRAEQLGRSFLESYPKSPLASRVHTLLRGLRPAGSAP